MMNLHFPKVAYFPDAPVEVMGNSQTYPEVLEAGAAFVRSVGFIPVLVRKEIMGFGLNTFWHEIKRAALHLADGFLDFEDLDRYFMVRWKQPGPFAGMDETGLDVVRDIEMEYYRESGDERDRPPAFLDKLIEQGRLGMKSGRGFYTWPHPEYEQPGWLRRELPWTPEMRVRLDEG